MLDETYDGARACRLVELLRGLAARIAALKTNQALLAAGPELLKIMGDARSELFHYEVRATYDTPEVVEGRRIVEQAQQQLEHLDFNSRERFDSGNTGEDEPWRGR